MSSSASSRLTFPRRMRLARGDEFRAVYDAATRVSIGPLLLYARPNDRAHPRLGLAVPRRVGGAVVRNTIKRRLREAFRIMQHDWPGICDSQAKPQTAETTGYDLVISVRPHQPLTLTEYQRIVAEAARDLHESWQKKHKRKAQTKPSDA